MNNEQKETIKRMYFEEKLTYRAIASLMGISYQRVHQIITGYRTLGKSFAAGEACVLCKEPAEHIHHLDGDSHNNKPKNLVPLCKACHYQQHRGRKVSYNGIPPRPTMEKNKAAQELGKRGGQKTALLHGKEHFRRIAKGWPKGKPRKKPDEGTTTN